VELTLTKITPDNVPVVVELIREFAAYENLIKFCEVTEEQLDKALFEDDAVVSGLLAWHRDVPVGYAIFYPNFASFRGQRGLYIEDIFVKAEYRKQGLGEMMIREIARLAAARGFERIDFLVLDWNTPAVNFYKKLGAVRDNDERHFKFTDDAFRRLVE
jgi:ribosomal protein S18 acetylase RimI-like enzyme